MDWRDLAGEMPLEQIVQALDDNRDGEVDEAAWERVQAGAAERLRDCFGGPPPAKFNQTCGYAQKVFMLEALYVRRGFYGKENPSRRRRRTRSGGCARWRAARKAWTRDRRRVLWRISRFPALRATVFWREAAGRPCTGGARGLICVGGAGAIKGACKS